MAEYHMVLTRTDAAPQRVQDIRTDMVAHKETCTSFELADHEEIAAQLRSWASGAVASLIAKAAKAGMKPRDETYQYGVHGNTASAAEFWVQKVFS